MFLGGSDTAEIVQGVFSCGSGDTSSFSSVWPAAGVVLGLFVWHDGDRGGFSRFGDSALGLSRVDRALLRAVAGLDGWSADVS